MTPYEILRHGARHVLPALYVRAHRDLRRLLACSPSQSPSLLDIGGRSSPYTIGLDAAVTIVDVPRASEVQTTLNLGIDSEVMKRLRRRRSNIETVRLEDMCQSTLPDAAFDAIVAVEVIEHIELDDQFMSQAARVLKPGGWAYFTTPNGDYVKNEPPNYNPDHLRHYGRDQLHELLERHFDQVEVVYAISTGRHRWRGLRPFSLRRPIQLVVSMVSNILSRIESRGLDQQRRRTAHLIAIARRA